MNRTNKGAPPMELTSYHTLYTAQVDFGQRDSLSMLARWLF